MNRLLTLCIVPSATKIHHNQVKDHEVFLLPMVAFYDIIYCLIHYLLLTLDHLVNVGVLRWQIWDVEIVERARDLYYNRTLETMAEAIMHNITVP